VPGAVGLEPSDFAGAVPGHCGEKFAAAVDDPQRGVAEFDGDDAPGVRQADVDALAGDLDAATAGYLPLDDRAGGRQRQRPGQPHALQLVPLGAAHLPPGNRPSLTGEPLHDGASYRS
jgi:hypothetical protein